MAIGRHSGSQASTLVAVSESSRIRGPSEPHKDGKDDASRAYNTDVDNLLGAQLPCCPRAMTADPVPSTGYGRGTTPTQNGRNNCRQRENLVDAARKTVYVYVKDGQIRISGKKGIPHWRFSRARWPGVLPSVVFDI